MKSNTQINALAAALVVTGAAGLFWAAGFSLTQRQIDDKVGKGDRNTAIPVVSSDVHAADTSALGLQSSAQAFAAMSETRQAALLSELLMSGTDADIQTFSNLIQSVTDASRRARLLTALDQLAREGAVEMVASFLRITDQPEIVAAVQRTLERAAQAETAIYLGEMAVEAGRPKAQRRFALEALSIIRNPAATEGLRDVVTTFTDEETVAAALISLGKLNSTASVEALISLFDRLPADRFAARHAVIDALKSSSSPENISLLRDLAANHEQPLVRLAAQDALASVSEATPSSLEED